MGDWCLLILGGHQWPIANCGCPQWLIAAADGSASSKPGSAIGAFLSAPTILRGAPAVIPHSLAGEDQSQGGHISAPPPPVPLLQVAYGSCSSSRLRNLWPAGWI